MTIHPNPFNGKCIHGAGGARYEQGVLISPNCAHCQRIKELAVAKEGK